MGAMRSPEGIGLAQISRRMMRRLLLLSAARVRALTSPAGRARPLVQPAGFARAARAALLIGALAACAGNEPASQDSAPPSLGGKAPSGFVEMRETQAALIASGGSGEGALTFQGRTYPFTVAGLGVGGIGFSRVNAQGEVYNLTDVADFPGTYAQGRYGAVAGSASVGELWLENAEGVVMHLKAEREGLMLSIGADAVVITMSE